jgi:hypothetical protein
MNNTDNKPNIVVGGGGGDFTIVAPAILIEGFRGFPQSLQVNAGIIL